jgi:hypothetical protein
LKHFSTNPNAFSICTTGSAAINKEGIFDSAFERDSGVFISGVYTSNEKAGYELV